MGKIHLLTGHGAGKTTSALGVALRAAGHGKKVIIIQFMKGRETGEVKALKKLRSITLRQFGTDKFIDMKNPSIEDINKAKKGMLFLQESLKKKPFLIILDEANLAASIGLINEEELITALKKKPKETSVYLTGRDAPSALLKFADFVTEVLQVKCPKKLYTREGITD